VGAVGGGVVVVWERDGGQLAALDVPRAGSVRSLALAEDRLIVAGTARGAVSCWSGPTWSPVGAWSGHDVLTAVAVAAGSGLVATAGEGGVKLWEADGALLAHHAMPGVVASLAMRDDGSRVACTVDPPGQRLVVLDVLR
jgi:sugar lactone lactonase YvrE